MSGGSALHRFLFVLLLVRDAAGLLCYNGTATSLRYGDDPLAGDGPFSPRGPSVARLRCSMGISCADNAMCFVRSWAARAKHAWLVQRGCYHAGRADPLPRTLHVPTRSMSCKHERLADAEYKVCLCQADWCNSAKSNVYHETQLVLTKSFVAILACYIPYF